MQYTGTLSVAYLYLTRTRAGLLNGAFRGCPFNMTNFDCGTCFAE